jgi:beta-N-acetylhexosaminidase
MINIGPLMLDIEGTELCNEDVECILHPACGGLILFSRNFQSSAQIVSLIQSIRSVRQDIIIAVDQEGGRVQRFKKDFSLLPPLATLGRLFQKQPGLATERASQFGELMAMEILSVGCDISFSPVLDLGLPASQIIGDRAFAEDQSSITHLAAAFVSGMSHAGMAATGKHFPGHGSAVEDSHLTIPIDSREEKTIQNNDIQPFIHLKDELLAMMPAHIIYPKIDAQPAGFSKVWIQQILRHRIGFDGVVFSDDLSMKGAEVAGDFTQRADKALSAGCDMLLLCNNRAQVKILLAHLKDFQLPEVSMLRLCKMLAKPGLAVGLTTVQKTARWQLLSKQVATLNQ